LPTRRLLLTIALTLALSSLLTPSALGAPNPAAATPILRIHFAGQHANKIAKPPTARPLILGRLTLRGHGLKTVAVDVYQAIPGHPVQLLASVKTNNRGRFSLRLPTGAPRTIAALYAGMRSNLLYQAQTVPVTLTVHPHLVRPGRAIHFSGSVPALRGGTGFVIALQVRRSGKFQTFEVSHTDSHGAFGGAYHFAAGPATYRFRAFVTSQNAFGYAPSASNTVRVHVT